MHMDILRIGVFLIGIALLIIAVLVAVVYFEVIRPRGEPPPFHAYCQEGYVVITANKDLSEVKVVDAEGRLYCAFDEIKAGSDKVCRVGNRTLYIVEHRGYTDVIWCAPRRPVAMD